MTLAAATWAEDLSGLSPVFGLRSKRGKLLLATPNRSLWPARKTFAVDQGSIVRR
jgi:hypothetical protein